MFRLLSPDGGGMKGAFSASVLATLMNLSCLWQQQGRRAEACDLLTPIYDWFTEDFDTAELQEAQALLAELGGITQASLTHRCNTWPNSVVP